MNSPSGIVMNVFWGSLLRYLKEWIISCHYLLIIEVIQSWNMLKISVYYLNRLISPSHYCVGHKLICWYIYESILKIITRYLKKCIIPCHYLVIIEVILIWNMLNLSVYYLQSLIPPHHYCLVHKLTFWYSYECILRIITQISQKMDHSMPLLGDYRKSTYFKYT